MSEPNTPEQQPADDLSEIYKTAEQPGAPAALGDEIRQAARDALQTPLVQNSWPWRQGVAAAAVRVRRMVPDAGRLIGRRVLHLATRRGRGEPRVDIDGRGERPSDRGRSGRNH